MVYIIPIPFIFIYWTVGITSSVWFVLRCWKSIIINSVAIFQNRNYILLSHFMNMSLMAIGFNRTPLPSLLLIFTIFEHMCLTTLSIDSNPHMNTVQIVVFEVLMLHENTYLLPSGEYYDPSLGNNCPTEHIVLLLVDITIRNQLVSVEVAKDY